MSMEIVYTTDELKREVKDEGLELFYFTTARDEESDMYKDIEDAYEHAAKYLRLVGELW